MDDDVMVVLIVAISIGGAIVLRWLKLRARQGGQLNAQQVAALNEMGAVAGRLEQRVAMLERILDAEIPAWRGQDPFAAPGPRGVRP
jgi:phage shock protein B